MTGDPNMSNIKDFFDLVIVDECHRGGAAGDLTGKEFRIF